MKKIFFLVVALVVMSWEQASADLYSFTFNGNGVGDNPINVSGTLNATNNNDGSYTVTSGSGFANGYAIILAAVSSTGWFVIDNKLWPANNPQLSTSGLLFSLPGGISPYLGGTNVANEINIWSGIPGAPYTYAEAWGIYGQGGDGYRAYSGTFNAAPVPIPAAVWLLGTGLVGLFGVRRRFVS